MQACFSASIRGGSTANGSAPRGIRVPRGLPLATMTSVQKMKELVDADINDDCWQIRLRRTRSIWHCTSLNNAVRGALGRSAGAIHGANVQRGSGGQQ